MAVILDAYSRRVVGWALENTLEGKLTIAVLRMALARRCPGAGLVHHCDRGVPYAAHSYVELLKQHEITISMSRKASPYDNARAESFMKTLKWEEVYRSDLTASQPPKGTQGSSLGWSHFWRNPG